MRVSKARLVKAIAWAYHLGLKHAREGACSGTSLDYGQTDEVTAMVLAEMMVETDGHGTEHPLQGS